MMKKIHLVTVAAVLSGLLLSSCWQKEVNGYYFQMSNGEITSMLPMGNDCILEYGESLDAILARPEMSFKLVASNPLAERWEVGEDQFFIEYYRDCSCVSNYKKIDAIKIPIPDWGSYQIKYIPKDMPEWSMTINFYIEASPKPHYRLDRLSKTSWAQDEKPPAPPAILNYSPEEIPYVDYYYILAETWNNATEEQKADPEAWVSESEEVLFKAWPDISWQIDPGEYYAVGYVRYPNDGKDYPDTNYYGYTTISVTNLFTVKAPADTP